MTKSRTHMIFDSRERLWWIFSNQKCIQKWDKKWDKYHWVNMWHLHSKISNFLLLYWFIWSIWRTSGTNHDSRNLSHFLSHFFENFVPLFVPFFDTQPWFYRIFHISGSGCRLPEGQESDYPTFCPTFYDFQKVHNLKKNFSNYHFFSKPISFAIQTHFLKRN